MDKLARQDDVDESQNSAELRLVRIRIPGCKLNSFVHHKLFCMRKIHLLFLAILVTTIANAQNALPPNPRNYEPVNPKTDQQQVAGYTVRLRPGINLTYAFDILQNDKPLHEATPNLLTRGPEGYRTKADAYAVAKWVIAEYRKNGHIPLDLPPHIAAQLNISAERLLH